MNEGANGAWLTRDPFTSEPHQSSLIFSYFLWLGKLSSLFHIPYAITYHFVRIIFGILSLFAAFYLIFKLKIPYPRATYLFFLFASPFMHPVSYGDKILNVTYMGWWTGIDAVRRAAYLPHHMFGSLLLILSIIMIFRFIKGEHAKKSYLYLLVFAALLAFVHTPSLLIILLVLPVSFAIHHLGKAFIKNDTTGKMQFKLTITRTENNNLLMLFGYCILSSIFLLSMISQTGKGFPWTQYVEWEKRLQFPLDQELIGAMGILFPLAIFGAIKSLFSKKIEYIFISCWLFIPFLLIPLAPKFNLSNIRLIQGTPFLPLAMLSAIGITAVEEIFTAIPKPKIKIKFKLPEHSVVLGVVLILFCYFSIPVIYWSVKDQIREYWPIFGNVYLDNRLLYAFSYIDSNFPKGTITLGTFYTGNYLPAYTHTTSYIGHFGYTNRINDKEGTVKKFFENTMTDIDAKALLTDNNITLVWQGPEEKPIYGTYLYPNILKPVYDRWEVTLYVLK